LPPPSYRGVRPVAPPPTPRHAAPRTTLPGAPGLRRAEVLPDRRRILTQNADGELAIWDIAAAAPVTRVASPQLPPAAAGSSGGNAASAAFEAARAAQEAALRVAAPAWFGVDVRTGELAIHLDPPGVFSAEAYASEYGLADAGDDAKINLGQQALLCCLGPWARARAAVEAAAAAGSADAAGDEDATDASLPPVMPPPSAFAFPDPPPVLVFDGPDGVRHRRDASKLSGSDAEVDALPPWAADVALRGKLPDVGAPTKMAFHLQPAEGCALPPLSQSKLNAPRILRASKIAGYLASELDLTLPDGDVARAQELLELTCAGQPVPWDMTLATAASFLWKQPGEELTIHYAPRGSGAGRLRGRV
jgi:WD repeat-containing protein 48